VRKERKDSEDFFKDPGYVPAHYAWENFTAAQPLSHHPFSAYVVPCHSWTGHSYIQAVALMI